MLARRHAPALADDLIAGLRALSSSSAARSSKRPRPAPAPRPPAAASDAVATAPSQQTQPAPAGQQWTEVVHPQTGPHGRKAGAGSLPSVTRQPGVGLLTHCRCCRSNQPFSLARLCHNPHRPPLAAGLVYYWNQRTGETTALGEPKPGPEGRLQQYRAPAAVGPAQAARGLGQLVLMGAGVGLAFALFARLF